MGNSIIQVAIYVLAGCTLGVLIGWSIHTVINNRRISELINQTRKNLDEVTAERDHFANEYAKSQSTLEQLQSVEAKHSAELGAALEKSKVLAKSVRTLLTERDNTKHKVSTIQNAFESLRKKTTALQLEFDKVREFYKRELLKSLQKRKDLEEEVAKARVEQESFARAVETSVLEHGSTENMVIAAQLRLGQLQMLERKVDNLESENAQLRQDAKQLKQQIEAKERDLEGLEELRVHNAQLVRCVEALEDSRKEHEADADRYRQQADQSEKLSDTLRLKLDDLQKNFADIDKQQREALEDARKEADIPVLSKQA